MSDKKGSSETDLFFIIESVTIFVEKMLEVIVDVPTQSYSKSQWSKFKDLLTSVDLSPCTCFSYANSLKLTRQASTTITTPPPPQAPSLQQSQVNTASFNLNGVYVKQPSIICLNTSQPSISPTKGFTSTSTPQQQQPNQVRKSQIGLSTNPVISQNGNNNNITINLINNSGGSNLQNNNNRYDAQSQAMSTPNNSNTSNMSMPFGQHFNFMNATPQSMSHSNHIASSTTLNKETMLLKNQSTPSPAGLKSSHGVSSSLRQQDHHNERVKSPQPLNPSSNNIHIPKSSIAIQNVASNSSHFHHYSTTSSNLSFQKTSSTSMSSAASKPRNLPSSHIVPTVNKSIVSPSKRVSLTGINANYNSSGSGSNEKSRSNSSSQSGLAKITSQAQPPSSYLSSQSSSAHIRAQKSLQIDIKEPSNLSQSKNFGSGNNNTGSSVISYQQNSARGEPTPVKSIQFNSINSLTTSKNYSSATPQASTHKNSLAMTPLGTAGQLLNSMQSQQQQNYLLSSQQSVNASMPSSPPIFSSINHANRLIGAAGKTRESITTTTATIINKGTSQQSLIDLNLTKVKSIMVESKNYATEQVEIQRPTEDNFSGVVDAAMSEQIPIRKRMRKETRKLSLEKFQAMNLDDIPSKVPSKPFLDELLGGAGGGGGGLAGAKDKKNARDPSPVNKRVGFEELSEMPKTQTVFKMDDYMDQDAPNPFQHLISQVQQRLNVFKMDTTTLQLISVKFVDIEQIKAQKEEAAMKGSSYNSQYSSSHQQQSQQQLNSSQQQGSAQQRGEIKRGGLKKYSVFAKKQEETSSNFRRIDEQITQNEQSSQNASKLFGNKKQVQKQDEKKKLIM